MGLRTGLDAVQKSLPHVGIVHLYSIQWAVFREIQNPMTRIWV